MPTPPVDCLKCQGLVVYEDEECYRCLSCGRRYFPERRPAPVVVIRLPRAKRDPEYHRNYMRVYMRAYRLKQKELPHDD